MILRFRVILGIAVFTFLSTHLLEGQVLLKNAFPRLSFALPVGLIPANDGTDRLFVLGQAGVVSVFQNDSGTASAKVFLNIQDSVASGGELGFLGLAFHPRYGSNGYFYVYYTKTNPSVNFPYVSVLSRFKVSPGNPDSADRKSELVLMKINQPFSNHKGGQLAFGRDGYLYIGLGDGGSGGDPQGNGQNTSTWLGKILRINVDSTSGSLNYAIPPDNPFASDTSTTVKREIFAYGFRNPWRFSFDIAGSGTLWVGDVGQDAWEEIDTVTSGRNYGWNIMEGLNCYNPPSGCDTTGLTMPILNYGHVNAQCAIIGGYVYRGSMVPELSGKYVYGDYCAGRIWALDVSLPGPPRDTVLFNTHISVSAFGLDMHGELYVCSYSDGLIYTFVSGSATVPPAPTLLVPPNGSLGVSVTPALSWHTAPTASSYHIQLATDSLFASIILADSTLADTFKTAGPLLFSTKYFWRVSAKNTLGPGPFSPPWSFTTGQAVLPPSAPVLISPQDGAAQEPAMVWFLWHASAGGALHYQLQVASDTTFMSLVFDDSTLSDTARQVGPVSTGTTFSWRVRAKNSAGFGPFSKARRLSTSAYSLQFPVRQSWNMVSLPLVPVSLVKDSLFPFSVSQAFGYSPALGYQGMDTLAPGAGYWMKFRDSQTVAIAGAPLAAETVEVAAGWNMIGSVSTQVSVAALVQIPQGILESEFYFYDGSYSAADVILPGRSYWVKAAAPGKVVLHP